MSNYSTRLVKFGGTATCTGLPHNYEYTQPFSISVWFKLETYVYTEGSIIELLSTRYVGSIGWRLCFFVSQATGDLDGALAFRLHSGASNYVGAYIGYPQHITSPFDARDGRWHHVLISYSGGGTVASLAFYVDGAAIAAVNGVETLAGTTVSTENLRLGSMAGLMDEVAIWNKALNASEAAWVWGGGDGANLLDGGAPSNLQSWWRMGEVDVSSTVLQDSGPLGAHATTSGVTVFTRLGSRGGCPGYLELPPTVGYPPIVTTTYIKRARDLGAGASFTVWQTTDINSAPPTSPPVGPWGEIVVTAKLEQ